MYTHKIPNHLEVEDVFILGLTIRQCVLIGVGAAMAYALFTDVFAAFADPVLGLVVGLVAAFLLFGCLLAVALVKLAGRGLDEWLLVLLIYWLRPRTYLWRFNRLDAFEVLDQTHVALAEQAHHEKEAEEW